MSTKLYYFDFGGLGEAVRMTLWLAKVPYEDVRLTFEQHSKFKEEGFYPGAQVPVLVHEGVTYNQSNALLRFIAN